MINTQFIFDVLTVAICFIGIVVLAACACIDICERLLQVPEIDEAYKGSIRKLEEDRGRSVRII